MNRCLIALLLLIGCGHSHAQGLGIRLPRPVQDIAASYARYDLNGDGIVEINSISLMNFEPAAPSGTGTRGWAIVLVEPRLLDSPSAAQNQAMLSVLRRHRDDLAREGYLARFLLTDVYRGPVHQDGRTLLALRRFLREVHSDRALKGVTLVGSFPEASLFRRVLSRQVAADGTQSLVLSPERVNPRAELVLADLDGLWEPLYRPILDKEALTLEVPASIHFPHDGQIVTGTVRQLDLIHAEDVFYLQDDFAFRSSSAPVLGGLASVSIASTLQRHPELTPADRARNNPVAIPELHVSRIDAHGIAFNPTGPLDLYGRRPLAANGKPQALEYLQEPGGVGGFFAGPPIDSAPTVRENGLEWTRDALLEQRILIDYFDRNHQHRIGIGHASQYRVASIEQLNSGIGSPHNFNNTVLRPADSSGFGANVSLERANLYHYASFLQTPSILKGVLAHSSDRFSAFFDHAHELPQNNSYAPFLEALLGGYVWAWDSVSRDGSTLKTPSAKAFNERAGWGFARTLWENKVLQYVGFTFYLHNGCSVTVPDGNSLVTSYDDLEYGYKNNADSVLLFQNGLAILARGKVFNDTPNAFGASIAAAGGQFGSAWRGAFLADAANAQLTPGLNGDDRIFHNKRSYFWSLRGDWSLKLRY